MLTLVSRTSTVLVLTRRVLTVALTALALAAGLVVTGAATGTAQAAPSGARAMEASFDAQVLHYTNVERRKRGLKALRPGGCADGFASRHTQRLAARDAFHHQALRPVLRQCHKRTAGENLAYRAPALSAQQVVRMWMSSPGHRANILKRGYRFLGVDAWKSQRTGRVYVGQVFTG